MGTEDSEMEGNKRDVENDLELRVSTSNFISGERVSIGRNDG
jgi:hypothetical protein